MSIQHRCVMTNWRACDAASLSLPPAAPSRHIFLPRRRRQRRRRVRAAVANILGRSAANGPPGGPAISAQLKLVPMAPSVADGNAASSRCDDERFGRTRASVPRVPSLAGGMTNSEACPIARPASGHSAGSAAARATTATAYGAAGSANIRAKAQLCRTSRRGRLACGVERWRRCS